MRASSARRRTSARCPTHKHGGGVEALRRRRRTHAYALDVARDQRCVVERCVDVLEPLDESLRAPFLSASSLDILRPDGVPSFTIEGELPLSLPGWLLWLDVVVSRLSALRPVLSWLARTPSLFRVLRGETALPLTLPLFASLERFVSDDAELPLNERWEWVSLAPAAPTTPNVATTAVTCIHCLAFIRLLLGQKCLIKASPRIAAATPMPGLPPSGCARHMKPILTHGRRCRNGAAPNGV